MHWKAIEVTPPPKNMDIVLANFSCTPSFKAAARWSKQHHYFEMTESGIVNYSAMTHWVELPESPKYMEKK